MSKIKVSTIQNPSSGTDDLNIDINGNVGIGTTSPANLLHLNNDATTGTDVSYFRCEANSSNFQIKCDDMSNTNSGWAFVTGASESVRFVQGAGEALKIDSSGNVGIGSTSPAQNLDVASTNNIAYALDGWALAGKGDSSDILFGGILGSQFDTLKLYTSGSERMRINQNGLVTNKTSGTFGSITTNGWTLGPQADGGGYFILKRDSSTPLLVNRGVNDGELIALYGQNTKEGSISVSGSTVSFNGGHLTRWSQLPGNAIRVAIYRGTVLSNIDEMCEWAEENNEQLNRMKISDIEGDRNVSGVFQNWDEDDEEYTDDFYCAMTGDFVIRIGKDVTVERGDLLMSAGDGTAKPQEDDIIRSKTIAKVTSTHVSETYNDGSYCVPCVLMAC